jgi:hypothetical protein
MVQKQRYDVEEEDLDEAWRHQDQQEDEHQLRGQDLLLRWVLKEGLGIGVELDP